MNPLGLLGIALAVVGVLMLIINSLIYYIRAFKVSALIGCLNLLFGMVYICHEPKEAWKPFVLAWLGMFIFIGGGILAEIHGAY